MEAAATAPKRGAVLVWFMFPKRDEENRLLAEYHAEDAGAAPEWPPEAVV